ncbi:MAG: serine protease [Saprospiraceae bacterium]
MTSNQKTVSSYQNILVQIATPTSVGMGFLLPKWKVIVTCEHIVRGNEAVVVQSEQGKVLTKVVYLDNVLDIAFLEMPEDWKSEELEITTLSNIETEIPVWVAAIPDSQDKIIETELTDTIEQTDKMTYLELDIPVVSDQSGSPVLDNQNRILGINSAMYNINDTFSFALASDYIVQALIHFYKKQQSFNNQVITKCFDCYHLAAASELKEEKCPNCHSFLTIEIDDYEPEGIARTIEKLLKVTGYNVDLTRKGPNSWEVDRGSATIHIIYNETDGYIVGDAILCRLSEEPTQAFYQYLLQQNYLLKGLNFSIKGSDIVLSVLIFERDLNMETGSILLQNLFERADYYDNVLVEEFGAKWL